MQGRVAFPGAERRRRERVARSDTRWLLAWLAVFVGGFVMLLAAHKVYRLTGPHPDVSAFVRMLKHYSRWLIPGQKGRHSSQMIPVPAMPPDSHYAGSSRTSGQEAQRANA